ncbi:MAG: 23S rRNA pseudouridine(2604) synthase RluF [Lachnospiraceae bacterium]
MEETGIRINKYLSESGVCSRREADRWVLEGNVTIDGKTAEIGDRVLPGQKVEYFGKPVVPETQRVLLVFNKPKGIVCTAEKREKNNVIDFLKYPIRIYPIGRLDKESSGLLLLTNDGELVNKIMRAGNMHEKEYLVRVNKPVTDSFLHGMANGVPILDTMTRKCRVEKTGKFTFRIVLTQGLNRQIRRMCEYFGYRVKDLQRVRIMNICLEDLELGTYRDVTEEEWQILNEMLADSSSNTVIPKKKDPTRIERIPQRKKKSKQMAKKGKSPGKKWKSSGYKSGNDDRRKKHDTGRKS